MSFQILSITMAFNLQSKVENNWINQKLLGGQVFKRFWTGGYRAAGGTKPWTEMWKWTDGSAFNFAGWNLVMDKPDNG